MNTFIFQPGSTWRKLGYRYFSNSLAYREVLEVNPFWDITKVPAPGTSLIAPDSEGVSSPGLIQAGITINPDISTQLAMGDYYPFQTKEEYMKSLARYNSANLSEMDRYNGWTSGSYQAQTGIQS